MTLLQMCVAEAQPVVVFSGWPPEDMLTAVRRLRQLRVRCMSAMAGSLEKVSASRGSAQGHVQEDEAVAG